MSGIKTAEGLGGSNVSPDDPRVRSEPPSGNQPRPSGTPHKEGDPEWVDRKDPDTLPKHLPNVGEGVAYDQASNTVVGMGGGAAEGQGGGASTTAALGAGHALGEAGSAEDRGVRGSDTQWGSGGPTRIPDRAEAGKAHLATAAGAGASARERARAGTNPDPASVPGDAPGLAGKTNWNQG